MSKLLITHLFATIFCPVCIYFTLFNSNLSNIFHFSFSFILILIFYIFPLNDTADSHPSRGGGGYSLIYITQFMEQKPECFLSILLIFPGDLRQR
jgi:hypothetical protein